MKSFLGGLHLINGLLFFSCFSESLVFDPDDEIEVLLQYYSVLQSIYYSVLQSTTPVLPCTTKYYSVLQSTTLYHKVLLRTTKYYSSTTKYYSSTTKYYSSTTKCNSVLPVLPCTTMKRHLQCAKQQKSLSNITKYCACHEELPSSLILVTYETSFTMRGATGITLQLHHYYLTCDLLRISEVSQLNFLRLDKLSQIVLLSCK